MLTTGAAAGVLAATGLPLRAAPTRSGTLRLGLSGASPFDSWDSRTHRDNFMIMAAHGAVFDTLTQVAASGELIGELAESWRATSDALVWTFKLRKGVQFHSGKAFVAEDVIGSLQLHMDVTDQSPALPIVSSIAEMRKINAHEVEITLTAPNADFPFLLADYHLCIYPAEQAELAMITGNGTGLYQVESFEPGVNLRLKRVESHYKDGKEGWFNEVELIAFDDETERVTALLEGQVHAIDRLPPHRVPLVQSERRLQLSEVTGNQHLSFPMLTNIAPFDDMNLRKALKHAVDRPGLVQHVLQGHGAVANDTPIGPANQFFAKDIPVASYDPDRARHYLAKAGLAGLRLDLSVANHQYPGALKAALLYQETAKAAGIDINVKRESDSTYLTDVWRQKPWCTCIWSGRLTEDWMLSTMSQTGAPWNDTLWDNAQYQDLLLSARSELDTAKRRSMYHDLQHLMALEGGAVVPVYANYLDAHSSKLRNSGAVGNVFNMDNARLIERWWFG
ncbi:ABC transporter substrate-binding protein [Cognatishimia sp. WU-CL00825]